MDNLSQKLAPQAFITSIPAATSARSNFAPGKYISGNSRAYGGSSSKIPPIGPSNQKLNNLLINRDINGYIFKPTSYAYDNARRFLLRAHEIMGLHYFDPEIIPDGEGGIDIEWEKGERQIMISLKDSPDRKNILYFQDGAKYGGNVLTLPYLKEKLGWFMDDAR